MKTEIIRYACDRKEKGTASFTLGCRWPWWHAYALAHITARALPADHEWCEFEYSDVTHEWLEKTAKRRRKKP